MIGFYLSGHPFAPYEQEIRRFAPVSLGRLKTQDSVRVAGFATGVRTMNGKSGRFAIVQLEDRSGFAEVSVSGELLEEARERLKADQSSSPNAASATATTTAASCASAPTAS